MGKYLYQFSSLTDPDQVRYMKSSGGNCGKKPKMKSDFNFRIIPGMRIRQPKKQGGRRAALQFRE
jgi:hypothetical protein